MRQVSKRRVRRIQLVLTDIFQRTPHAWMDVAFHRSADDRRLNPDIHRFARRPAKPRQRCTDADDDTVGYGYDAIAKVIPESLGEICVPIDATDQQMSPAHFELIQDGWRYQQGAERRARESWP